MATKKKPAASGKKADSKKATGKKSAAASKPAKKPAKAKPAAAEHDHDHDHDHGTSDELARVRAVKEEGVHRAGDHEGPFSLHVLGLGATGASVIKELLKRDSDELLAGEGGRFTALAVDIGDQDLQQIDTTARAMDPDRIQVRTAAMDVPTRSELMGSLNRYREFLKMEYPRYYWNPNYEPWLPSDIDLPATGSHVQRALAKAIYGSNYYQDGNVAGALDDFADSVNKSTETPIVAIVFSMAGGAGSGMVVEIARHLSSIKLGRRPWVVGIGVMPCDGDEGGAAPAHLFPVINELDCMIDAEKNQGVMAVWGDLYKNPFTGGFFTVPQNDVYALTQNLAETHAYVDEGIANFLLRDHSVHLYETLKAQNWLGVSADTWHPAIRGEQSDHWVNLLTWRKGDDVSKPLGDVGLKGTPLTEYAEVRLFGSGTAAAKLSDAVGSTVTTLVEPGVLIFEGGNLEGANVIVPRLTKLDLQAFTRSRDAYDQLEWDDKLMIHSWLLDLGVMLCEPSIRFDGMGGECIWGCACWVVVPHAAIRGEESKPAVDSKVG